MAKPFKTEAERRAYLKKRREYYQKNREHIRERDNATARKKRAQNPERYREYATRFHENKKMQAVYADPAHYNKYAKDKEQSENEEK